MNRNIAILALAAIVAVTLYWRLGIEDKAQRQAQPANAVTVPGANLGTQDQFDSAAMGLAPAPVLGTPAMEPPTNDRAPDPRWLAGRPDRQAVFDDAAKPGEFVTPPKVSIEH